MSNFVVVSSGRIRVSVRLWLCGELVVNLPCSGRMSSPQNMLGVGFLRYSYTVVSQLGGSSTLLLSLSLSRSNCMCVCEYMFIVCVCVCELLFMCVCIEVFLFAAFRVLCFCLLSYRLHQRSIKCVCVSVRVRGCECGCAAVCATNKNVAIFNWVPLGFPESELDKNSLIKKPQEKSCHNK